ncbi:hypothetical protein JCM10207_003236 [Rhodosporidiobolus poonsookiae]
MPALLPRRTAWTTPAELHLVYSRLFLSGGDLVQQHDGLARIKVWIARGYCPHAVESTANLLELILADSGPSTSSSRSPSPGELRLSYSMAIIRFVNSLVDPLQTTYYARSIASLAAQLGLPLWFVELRHQATHEELPALGVLRNAARQALDWLYSSYWSPLLTSPTAPTLPALPLDTLRPSLAAYKALLKTSVRDASLAPRLKNDLLKVYKEIERWVAENAIGAREVGDVAARERALLGVVEVLVEEAGGLVPLGKKKRPSPRAPTLSPELVALWQPLLARLDETYATSPSLPSSGASATPSPISFTDLVLQRCVELLCAPLASSPMSGEADLPAEETAKNPAEEDKSYALTLMAWVAQLVVVERDEAAEDDDERAAQEEQVEGIVKQCLLAGTPNALALLDTLLRARASTLPDEADDPLATKVKPLVQLLRGADSGFTPTISAEQAADRVLEMEQRWREVDSRLSRPPASLSRTASPRFGSPAPATAPAHSPQPVANGGLPAWLVPVEGWTPCPIGTLPHGGVEALDLLPAEGMVQ